MTVSYETRLATLIARRESLEAMFYSGVPLQKLCDSVPGVGDEFVRQYLRTLKLDWNRRMLFIEQHRRQRNLKQHEHKEQAMQRESDRQAEQWRALLKGRHFGHVHSRTFIPDRRFAKPAAWVECGSILSLAAMDAPGI